MALRYFLHPEVHGQMRRPYFRELGNEDVFNKLQRKRPRAILYRDRWNFIEILEKSGWKLIGGFGDIFDQQGKGIDV